METLEIEKKIETPKRAELWTLAQAAAYIGITTRTLQDWRWSRPRRGPRAIKIGNKTRFTQQLCDEWLASQTEKAGRR